MAEATETLSNPHAPSAGPIKVYVGSAAHPLSGVAGFDDALRRFDDETMDGLRG